MDDENSIAHVFRQYFIYFLILFPILVKAGNNKQVETSPHVQYEKIIYLSPLPDADYVMPCSDIIIRTRDFIDKTSLSGKSLFLIEGSSSGSHSFSIILSGGRTIILKPDRSFSPGEMVNIKINNGIKTTDGKEVAGKAYSFTVKNSNNIAIKNKIILDGFPGIQAGNLTRESNNNLQEIGKIKSIKELPDDFPVLQENQADDPSKGYIFLAAFGIGSQNKYGNYLIIADNEGNPIYYKKMDCLCTDFKMQPDGTLTYFNGNKDKFYQMNTSFSIIDSFQCGNGYQTDVHELRILPNGNSFIIGDDFRKVDMSRIVQGGNPNATVIDNIVQELDKDKNVIFQWRGLDHFKITDATHQDLTADDIDYEHMNAIEIDGDSCILISSRHMDEITKINTFTGNIVWRMGGSNNQFRFINDDIGFSHQHAIRKTADGDLILFDDGNFHDPPFSRAVEYKPDEVNKTVSLVWQYRNSPDIYGSAMGYVQRLENGNSLIGWGNTNPSVTEVTPSGKIALEITLPKDIYSYRAYRFPLILLSSPNGSEEWGTSSVHQILWTCSGVDSVFIDYSTDSGKSWIRIVRSYPADSEKYSWTVPRIESQNCLIRIGDASMPFIKDVCESDSLFEIDSSFSVELSSFRSNFKDNTLQMFWQTAKEKNNYGFEIQRKYAAENWSNLAFIQSKSDESIPANYEYTDTIDTTSLQGNVLYRLAQIDSSGGINYLKQLQVKVNIVPDKYILMNNYPNPFNPLTVIKYSIPYDSHVIINIYNTLGQLVEKLFDAWEKTGDHKVTFNASEYSSGIYFYEMQARAADGIHYFRTLKKMVFMK